VTPQRLRLRSMGFFDRRTSNILLTILVFALALAIIYLARTTIVIFAFSILFAYLIDPVVRFLQRHSLFFKNLRGPHIVEAYLALIVLVVLVTRGLAPKLHENPIRFLGELSAEVDKISTGEIADDLVNELGWSDAQAARVSAFLQQHRQNITAFMEEMKRLASTAIAGILVIPILAIFFLSAGEKLANQIICLFSAKSGYDTARSLAGELHKMLQHYIRAKVTLVGLSLTYCLTMLLALGYSYPVGLALLAGILEFIPVAGWMAAAATIVGIGILTHSHWIWMLALLCVWRVLMDYFIAPRVMGHELEIHPLLAIFTMMVGGAVGGIVGIYLSIPLVAALRVIWHRFASENPQTDRAPVIASASYHQ
jgi:predicted PurR-regulated permease PerM